MHNTGSIDGLMAFSIPVGIAFLGATVAAVSDVVHYRVRNVLTLPMIATGVAYHAIFGGWNGFSDSMGGVLFGLVVLIVPWLLGLMGAGDVKLLAGVGAWLGTDGATVVFVAAAAVTCLYACVLIVYRGKIRESLLTMKVIFYRFVALGTYLSKDNLAEELCSGPDHRLRVIPFGAMIPLGIVGALIWFAWFKGVF